MKRKIKRNKLENALEAFNAAASEKRKELSDLFRGKYGDVSRVINITRKNGKRVIRRTEQGVLKAEKKLIHNVKKIDSNVHKNPWPYLGAVAVGSMVVGVLMGNKKFINGKYIRKAKKFLKAA